MQEYEIRILRPDRTTAAVIEATYFSDDEAVREAKRIAQSRPFEVWRDLDCLYGRPMAGTMSAPKSAA